MTDETFNGSTTFYWITSTGSAARRHGMYSPLKDCESGTARFRRKGLAGPSRGCPDRPRTGAWARLPRPGNHRSQCGLQHVREVGLRRERRGAGPCPREFAGASGDIGPPSAIPGLRGLARRPAALHKDLASGILENPRAGRAAGLVGLRCPASGQVPALTSSAPGSLQFRPRRQ